MSGIFAVFTPDCVSFCEVSSHAANSKGRRLRFWAATGVFKIYDAENGLILSSEVVSTNGQGHGALVGFLVQHQVNVVLYGGIGAGATDYLAGRLVFDPNAHCNHHAHEAEHACGSHSCHEDKGGCAGSCH